MVRQCWRGGNPALAAIAAAGGEMAAAAAEAAAAQAAAPPLDPPPALISINCMSLTDPKQVGWVGGWVGRHSEWWSLWQSGLQGQQANQPHWRCLVLPVCLLLSTGGGAHSAGLAELTRLWSDNNIVVSLTGATR